jgi:DNA-binding LacI/PurR family transcriptional regulator/AraC-like DNA-binding protein
MVARGADMNRRQYIAERERTGKRPTIGFAGIADFRSVIGQEYIAGVGRAAVDYGLNLLNFAGAVRYSVAGDADFIKHYVAKYRFMRPPIVEGLVTWASSLTAFMDYGEIGALHAKLGGLPMVDLGVPILQGVPSVTIDTAAGIRAAMDHLVGVHGYTRIGFVGLAEGKQYRDRLDAWRAEMRRLGLEEDPEAVAVLDSPEPADVGRWLGRLRRRVDLRGRRGLDALVTVSDIVASQLIDELIRLGYRVPADLAVVGFNNQLAGLSSPCPITTVDLGYRERGYAAVELLIDRLRDPEAALPGRISRPTLVVRESCGCFEPAVRAAGGAAVRAAAAGLEAAVAEAAEPGAAGLAAAVAAAVARLDPPAGGPPGLADAIAAQLADSSGGAFLLWLRRSLEVDAEDYLDRLLDRQNLISRLRAVLLPLAGGDAGLNARIEDCLHEGRALLLLTAGYRDKSHRTDAYRFNNLARIAIGFAAAVDGEQIKDAIRLHLPDLEMPGIMLVLQDELTPEPGAASLELVHPPPGAAVPGLPYRLGDGAFIPLSFFPKDRRWTMVPEILYCSGMHIGYALIESGPANVALYDAVRTLLSHALYAAYLRNGRDGRAREALLRAEPVAGILEKSAAAGGPRSGLDARAVIDYLLDRLGEPTDLDAMARGMGLSKSYLIRRAKSLTGYTVQTLHERLKIERAKTLLEDRQRKIADIAAGLGYQDQCYFSAVFRKRVGLSPREWRRRAE